MPALPDPHGLFALAMTVLAFALFIWDRLPLETSSLVVLIALALGFELFPYYQAGSQALRPAELFAGFGNEALIAVCALMIVGKGLETTGALRSVVAPIVALWKSRPALSFVLTLVVCALLSAFLNNTPIVVILLPILVSVSLRSRTPASAVLMPMGFATLIGGMATTIGTSTNLLVVGVAANLGMERFGMFDFTLPALLAGIVGIAFLWLLAPRLLPERTAPLSDTSPRIFDAVLHVNADSFAHGKTLAEVLRKTSNRMKVAQIQRATDLFLMRLPTVTLREGDRLYISDTPENLKEYEGTLGATLYNVSDLEHPVTEEHPLTTSDQQLAEVVVTDGSALHRITLERANFAARYNVVVLAVHRAHGHSTHTRRGLSDVVLRTGDVVLLQGPRERIRELRESGRMLVLDATVDLPSTRKAPVALGIMCAVVAATAFGFVPISVSALCGVGLMLFTKCLNWQDAANALSTKIILIVAVSLALGLTLMRTGSADYLAQLFLAGMHGLSPAFVLSGLILLLAILTNLVSNNAAAVIGTPIAFSIAQQLEVSPEPFVLAVMFGANMSFATPFGYQTNLLVLSAGGYGFNDFLRVGIPLTVVMWLAYSLLLPMLYTI